MALLARGKGALSCASKFASSYQYGISGLLKNTIISKNSIACTSVKTFSATSASTSTNPFAPLDTFVRRHIGPRDAEIKEMVKALGYDSLEAFSKANVPKTIQLGRELNLGKERGEKEMLDELKEVAKKNKVLRSFIGMGYHNTITPPVIQRNILENPGWYTAYTPYQAEISQGRLEMLLNYQTVITELTGLDVSNASLLDEATSAAEAMHVPGSMQRRKRIHFLYPMMFILRPLM